MNATFVNEQNLAAGYTLQVLTLISTLLSPLILAVSYQIRKCKKVNIGSLSIESTEKSPE